VCRRNHKFKHALQYQQDTHEFFHTLLDLIDNERKDEFSQMQHSLLSYITTDPISECQLGDSTCSDPMLGRLLSEMTCLSCYRESTPSRMKFSVISLPIVSKFNCEEASVESLKLLDSVESAFEEYTSSEKISGVKCDYCGQKANVRRRVSIGKAPKVLCLHFNRKFFHLTTQRMIKIESYIDFGEFLDLSPFLFYNRKRWFDQDQVPRSYGARYKLKGIIVHHGSAKGGHYTAFRRLHKNQWAHMSDGRVSLVSLQQVLRAKLYMGFYEKVSVS